MGAGKSHGGPNEPLEQCQSRWNVTKLIPQSEATRDETTRVFSGVGVVVGGWVGGALFCSSLVFQLDLLLSSRLFHGLIVSLFVAACYVTAIAIDSLSRATYRLDHSASPNFTDRCFLVLCLGGVSAYQFHWYVEFFRSMRVGVPNGMLTVLLIWSVCESLFVLVMSFAGRRLARRV